MAQPIGRADCQMAARLVCYSGVSAGHLSAAHLKRWALFVSTRRTFKPGFRLSLSDAAVLVVGAVVAAWLAQIDWVWSFLVAFVVGHFFVFCNVIRMARQLELVWALQFLLLSLSTLLVGSPSWLQTFSLAFASTLVLIVMQLRKPSYHGVYWKRLNPNLPEWWKENGE